MRPRAAVLLLPVVLALAAPAQPAASNGGRAEAGAWRDSQWYPPYPPYPMRYDAATVAVRVDVEPTEAEVYVNGYLAGQVDDFDGVFQRLRLRPGEHEITIHLDGYRSIVEKRYFNPHSTLTIRRRMQPLGPGETQEPPPTPVAPPTGAGAAQPQAERPGYPEPPPRRERPAPLGTLSLRVDPADAEIVVDGKPQPRAPADAPVAFRLAPGRYKIEVRREGYTPYVEDVLIRPEAMLSLTVTLTKR